MASVQASKEDISHYYTIAWDKLLGKGAGGLVYAAKRISDGLEVAVKIVQVHERTKTELALMIYAHRMSPANVVQIYAVFHNQITFTHEDGHCYPEDRFFIVMELMGTDLFEYIRKVRGLSEEKARDGFKNVIYCVAQLHSVAIVHRDLKPDNILLDRTLTSFKLTDFGWAKKLFSANGNTSYLGTARHNAPEIGSGSYSYAVDVFSLGTVLCYMLTGTLPYSDWDLDAKFRGDGLALLDGPRWAGVSLYAKNLVRKMLAGDPTARPTLREILESDPWINAAVLPVVSTTFDDLAGKGDFSSTARMARHLNVDPSYLATPEGAETLVAEQQQEQQQQQQQQQSQQTLYAPTQQQQVQLAPSVSEDIYFDISRFEIGSPSAGAHAGALF